MINPIYKNVLVAFILLLVQILILNNIHFLGKGTPMIYIYIILSLPKSMSRIGQLFIAFALGLWVDVFANTPGMHASATLWLAFLSPHFVKMCMPLNDYDIEIASMKEFGFMSYLNYVLMGTLLHHTVLMCLEAASIQLWQVTLERIGLSVLLTIPFIMIINLLNYSE